MTPQSPFSVVPPIGAQLRGTTAPIVRSLLETDLYKFTMWQALFLTASGNSATYRFVCRNTPAFPLATLEPILQEQLQHLCSLRLSTSEISYLRSLGYFGESFLEYLRTFQLNPNFLRISTDNGTLSIEATGPQIAVMPFEIYILYLVSELYQLQLATPDTLNTQLHRMEQKIEWAQTNLPSNLSFFDFGLRRRSSALAHETFLNLAAHLPQLKGTSNVYLAQKTGLAPIGTMAHEYLQTFQAMPGVPLHSFQHHALQTWLDVYRGDLAVALTDVITMDSFLKTFTPHFARAYTGLRHDSGCPFQWARKAISHYQKLGIKPEDKKLVFSDGLNFEVARKLHNEFHSTIPTAFGIGTWLTNDSPIPALNLVMKIVECNGQPVAKISDSPGKTICDNHTFISYLQQVA